MSLEVVEVPEGHEPLWDEFVNRSPDGLPHQLLGWRQVMSRTYGYRSHYLMARDSDGVQGVMPLIEVPSLLEGHHLTTMPGGLCAQSEEAGQALLQKAMELVQARGAEYLVIRDTRRVWNGDLVTVGGNCSVVVDLRDGCKPIWRELRSSVRTNTRQAERAGLVVREGLEQLDAFYDMFARFCRDRGTPVFGRTWLRNIVEVLGPEACLLGAWQGEEMVGGYFALRVGTSLAGVWGAALSRYHHLRPNDALYWRAIETVCERKLTRLDLGRSRMGSGQHRFKLKWRGSTVPLYHQYYLCDGARPPASVEPDARPLVRRAMRIWSRLPLRLTELLGPVMRKHIPFG
ncbi:MAG: GNAT family N-acetyltransferase [Anaerolineae bacterium]|nr:GNAT family N-acetyltransferase [Anaerolineae bacterium]